MVATPHTPKPPVSPPRPVAPHTVAHTAVFAPWTSTTDEAVARMKTEMTLALSALQGRTGAAGKLLDIAYSTAAGPAAQMRAAAYAAFHQWMANADAYTHSILDPAIEAYDKEIGEATEEYNAALSDALKTYKAILSAATTAKNEAASFPSVA